MAIWRLTGVAENGCLSDEDNLPEGVTSAHIEKTVAGYVAQADETLSAVEAPVDTLVGDVDRRRISGGAHGDHHGRATKMQHFGKQAANRLASLPSANPEAFAEMVQGMTPDERKALSQNAKGEWIVTVPGKPGMSFGAAVRAGLVRV